MQVFRNLPEVKFKNRSVLTIGTYDGVHRGHQIIVQKLMEAAQARHVPGILVTLHPHPGTVLVPDRPAALLTTPEEKIAVLEELGLDIVVILPFTREFAQTPARQFIKSLVDAFHPLQIWEGYDFAWGKNREGDIDLLRQLGRDFDFEVGVVEAVEMTDDAVSSTRIRRHLKAGQVRQAADLLGRYPSWRGVVTHGARRGRTIGFPTANLAIDPDRLLPADGVYAVFVQLDGRRYPGVANVGVRPSFNETVRTVEVHIFDFSEELYGRSLQIDLVAYLRPEIKFGGLEALLAQIKQDAAQARLLLNEELKLLDALAEA